MLLAIDIGNSAVKFGLFDGSSLTSKFSIPTKRDATADEIRSAVGDRLGRPIEAAIACSVVPDVEPAISSFLTDVKGIEPTFVRNTFDFGFKVNYKPLASLGTDRLVNAHAAVGKYGAPVIVCSLGTATTLDVVSKDREFLGGMIAPGLEAMAEALHIKAPRLPAIKTEKPSSLIGNSTIHSIQSGVYFGYVAMIEGLIGRVKAGTGVATVVATGGNAKLVAEECDEISLFDPDLMMNGLYAIAREA